MASTTASTTAIDTMFSATTRGIDYLIRSHANNSIVCDVESWEHMRIRDSDNRIIVDSDRATIVFCRLLSLSRFAHGTVIDEPSRRSVP